MASRIQMIQGSSIAPEVIEQVKTKAPGKQCMLVATSLHLDAINTARN